MPAAADTEDDLQTQRRRPAARSGGRQLFGRAAADLHRRSGGGCSTPAACDSAEAAADLSSTRTRARLPCAVGLPLEPGLPLLRAGFARARPARTPSAP